MDNKRLDEAVEAMRAKLEDEFQWDCRGYPEDHGLDELRAALLAALPVLLG